MSMTRATLRVTDCYGKFVIGGCAVTIEDKKTRLFRATVPGMVDWVGRIKFTGVQPVTMFYDDTVTTPYPEGADACVQNILRAAAHLNVNFTKLYEPRDPDDQHTGFLDTIVTVLPDRAYIDCHTALQPALQSDKHWDPVSGKLHKPPPPKDGTQFPPAWEQLGSWKLDREPTMQITMWAYMAKTVAEIDFDMKRTLIGHGKEVLHNALTGDKTSSLLIHQLLAISPAWDLNTFAPEMLRRT